MQSHLGCRKWNKVGADLSRRSWKRLLTACWVIGVHMIGIIIIPSITCAIGSAIPCRDRYRYYFHRPFHHAPSSIPFFDPKITIKSGKRFQQKKQSSSRSSCLQILCPLPSHNTMRKSIHVHSNIVSTFDKLAYQNIYCVGRHYPLFL